MSYKEDTKKLISDVETQKMEDGDDITQVKAKPSKSPQILRATLMIVFGFIGGLLIIQIYKHHAFRLQFSNNDIFKISTQFRGADNIHAEQHVTSVLSNNYVIYHVIKPEQTTWIVDDFERSLQVMKITTAEDNVCFVAHLNRSHSISPDVFSSEAVGEDNFSASGRQRVQTTFSVDDVQLYDLSVLGSQATELCANTPTYWIYPVTSPRFNESDTHHREKRNVKKCITSCCLLVCCCNQRYLQWETHQKINCHNVCQGCSPHAKMSSHEVC